MPVVAYELPQAVSSSGSSQGATASRRPVAKPGAADGGPAASFRQQLSDVASRSGRARQTDAGASRSDGKSRSSRAEAGGQTKTASKAPRKQGAEESRESSDADNGVETDDTRQTQQSPAVRTGADALDADEAGAEGGTASAADPSDDTAASDDAAVADATGQANPMLVQAAGNLPLATSAEPAAVATPRRVASSAANVPATIEPIDGPPAGSAAAANTSAAGDFATAGEAPVEAGESPEPQQPKRSAGVSALGAKPMARPDPEPIAAGDTAGASSATGASCTTVASTAPAVLAMSMVEQFAEAFTADGASPTTAAGQIGDSSQPGSSSSAVGVGQFAKALGRQMPDSAPTSEAEQPTEARFAALNHARIASDVRGALLPNGGRMELKLDPPELGALQVSLHLKDGVVTASFQTQNPDAARLLSHTLSDLRASLEAHGVIVDRLHVQQAPKDEGGGNNAGNGRHEQTTEQQNDRREQQRKEMVQRLWDQLAGKGPIDVRA